VRSGSGSSFATQTTFHALGYAVLASATLREAFERIIRYRRLIGDVVELSLQDVGDRTRFIIDVSAPPRACPTKPSTRSRRCVSGWPACYAGAAPSIRSPSNASVTSGSAGAESFRFHARRTHSVLHPPRRLNQRRCEKSIACRSSSRLNASAMTRSG